MSIDKETITFRRATLNDIKKLVNLRIEFLTTSFGSPEREEDIELVKNQIRKYLERAIPSSQFISWLAEQDNKIIATSALTIWESLATFSIQTGLRGRILNMFTLPEARKMGINTKLLNRLLEDGKRLGVTCFNLDATKDGINIYKNKGFIEPEDPELVYYP